MSSKIYYVILLHAHMPYINHPDSNYLEENWYFENIAESYIPLLRMIERLSSDGINPNLTISLSPTLCHMMENEVIERKLKKYIELRLKLIEKERESYGSNWQIKNLLDIYEERYLNCLDFINKYSGDLITPFKLYQNQGLCEIITTPATYPIIPLIINDETMNAQISIASLDYKDRFSRDLAGIFLSECAYDERVDSVLEKNSINYFFVDSNAIDLSKYDPYQSYLADNDISFFVRDDVSVADVLDINGYISNPLYREFYRDIGYERDISYLKEFTLTEERIPTGIKYHRITSINKPLGEKEIYDYDLAIKQSEADAYDFLIKRINQFKSVNKDVVVVSCFNAEIFGHRWFEGINFLENIFRKTRSERFPIQFITPSNYLLTTENKIKVRPELSSSSENGFFDKWLNEKNDFIYPFLYEITRKFIKTVNKFLNSEVSGDVDKALRQLTREILLMQSSDWAAMINMGDHKEYAIYRIKKHYENSIELINMLNSLSIDMDRVKKLERENGIFPFIDWRVFSSKSSF
ncbi:MAG: DUF1957 domain-containing protein [Elusimicrobiota bacterium]